MRSLALVAFATLVLGACDDSVQFRLRLEWQRRTSESSAQACPQLMDGSYSCSAIALSCDVQVRVRIIGATNDETYYSDCFAILSNGDACQLRGLPIEPRGIPNEMVRVQVIVWTIDELEASGIPATELAETGGCPVTTQFDSGGLPRLGVTPVQPGVRREPVPALGGETYFLVGQSPTATVTLGCPQYPSLDAPVCRDDNLRLHATILDPEDFFSISRPDEDDNFSLRYGVPQEKDGTYRVVGSQLSPALDVSPEGDPLAWDGSLLVPPEELGCLVTDRSGPTAGTIHCFDTVIPEDGPMLATGYMVDGSLQIRMRQIYMRPDFPTAGMVLGVVVDADGQAVSGATVSAGAGGTVIYPDLNFVGVRPSTDAKGLFLSDDAGFETAWTATASGNRTDDGTARGGRVQDHVTVVVVRLGASASAPPP
jgi:hypothetical protein